MKHIDNSNSLVLKLTNKYNHSDKTIWTTNATSINTIKYWMSQDREKVSPFISVTLLLGYLKADLMKIDALLKLDYPEKATADELNIEIEAWADEYHVPELPLEAVREYISSLIDALEKFIRPYGYEDMVYELQTSTEEVDK